MIDCFDNPPDRSSTHTIKWDKNLQKFGRADLLPLWIADMDFAVSPAIQKAIEERASHGIYGYTYRTEEYTDSIVNWLINRFDWQVSKRDLLFFPSGTVSALNMLVNLLTDEGDEVIVQTPSYPPLMNVVKNNKRVLIKNSLKLSNSGYQMDLAQLESQVSDKTKLLLLCSPHNPSGRVWKESELLALADLCRRNDITIVSDEVHSDLVIAGKGHIHFNRLPKDQRPKSVSIVSSCKTFNLAGLPQATLICDSTDLKVAIQKQINNAQINLDGIFSAVATQAAYDEGEYWLNSLIEYLSDNRAFLQDYLNKYLPKVVLIPAEGTYLAWLDFREYGFDNKTLGNLLVEKGGVGLYDGTDFGEEGEGFFRLNFACPRATLEKALKAIQLALSL